LRRRRTQEERAKELTFEIAEIFGKNFAKWLGNNPPDRSGGLRFTATMKFHQSQPVVELHIEMENHDGRQTHTPPSECWRTRGM
jgi:hypothetical protein